MQQPAPARAEGRSAGAAEGGVQKTAPSACEGGKGAHGAGTGRPTSGLPAVNPIRAVRGRTAGGGGGGATRAVPGQAQCRHGQGPAIVAPVNAICKKNGCRQRTLGALCEAAAGMFLVCGTLGSAACLSGRLTVVRIGGGAGHGSRGMESSPGLLVAEAVAARADRMAEGKGGHLAVLPGGMRSGRRVKLSPNGLKGLIGEIVAEAVLAECGYGEPFCSKWRHRGTGVSRGVDIMLCRGGILSANESKHLHALRPGASILGAVSSAIFAAFGQCGEDRTRSWLEWLRRQCADAERLQEAAHAVSPGGVGDMRRMIEAIDRALSGRSVPTNAVAVFDARHEADAVSIRGRLGPGALRNAGIPAAAVAASIDGLHEATAALIRRCC